MSLKMNMNMSICALSFRKADLRPERAVTGKVDMQAFRERCEFEMEKGGDLLEIDGSSAAQELARSLEKNGIIKVKGDSVKWKR